MANRPGDVGPATTCGRPPDSNSAFVRVNVLAPSVLKANTTHEHVVSAHTTATRPKAAPRCGLPTGATSVGSLHVRPPSVEATMGPISPTVPSRVIHVWTAA